MITQPRNLRNHPAINDDDTLPYARKPAGDGSAALVEALKLAVSALETIALTTEDEITKRLATMRAAIAKRAIARAEG